MTSQNRNQPLSRLHPLNHLHLLTLTNPTRSDGDDHQGGREGSREARRLLGLSRMAVSSSAHRVHIDISSKEGAAVLSIDHPKAGQSLMVPIYPHNAAEAVASLLEPAFAHYARMWEVYMVSDPSETDARGFYLEAHEVPDRIADPLNASDLVEAARPFYRQEDLAWFPNAEPVALYTHISEAQTLNSNVPDMSPHEVDARQRPLASRCLRGRSPSSSPGMSVMSTGDPPDISAGEQLHLKTSGDQCSGCASVVYHFKGE